MNTETESADLRMVLIKGAGETARAFYDYLQSDAGREVFRRHGFGLPPR